MVEQKGWLEALPPKWQGPLRLTVQGRSMWPTLRPGDRLEVEPVLPEELRRGDWVVLRASNAPLVHRFLGFTRDGRLLTKGDGHRAPDPSWELKALVGRVVSFSREGQAGRHTPRLWQERLRTAYHRGVVALWRLVRGRGRPALLGFLALLLFPLFVRASVTLSSFTATPQTSSIYIQWETASETSLRAGECSTLQWQTGGARAVYLNERGVAGTDARTFCPCQNETYVLRVVYLDGSSEERSITLQVSGSCPAGGVTPTATATTTPRPPATPSTVTPTPPLPLPPSPTASRPLSAASPDDESATPTATPTREAIAQLTSPVQTPASQAVSPLPSSTPLPPRSTPSPAAPSNTGSELLILAALLGLAFVGVGGWGIWRAWKER